MIIVHLATPQNRALRYCHGSWICVLILCSSMGWVRSLCLSALPSTWRGNQDGYRCSSSALPISGWRFCDALSDRCFAGGSLILCVSLPGLEAVLAWSRFCRFPDGSGLYSLPGLETLLCRAHCTCTADEICTCTADRSAPARPLISSHPLYFGVFLIKILFSLAIGSRAFCTVTERSDQDGSSQCVRIKRLFSSQ